MLKRYELRDGGRTVRTLEMTDKQASDFVSFEGDTLVEIPTRTLSDGAYRQGKPAPIRTIEITRSMTAVTQDELIKTLREAKEDIEKMQDDLEVMKIKRGLTGPPTARVNRKRGTVESA